LTWNEISGRVAYQFTKLQFYNWKKRKTIMAEVQKIQVLPLTEIVVDTSWNARSNLEESSGGPDEGTGLEGLQKSIALRGQDEPVVVRANPAGKGKPFALVAGFRRFEAIRRIAEAGGDKAPTILAVIKKLSEGEARELNVRENTVRDSLSGADLAFGIKGMLDATPTLTDLAIADTLGLSQGHVSTLHRIMVGVKPNILKHWRESPLKISVVEMNKLATIDKGEQQARYEELTRGKENPKPRGPGAWVSTAKDKAEGLGKLFGTLQRKDLITVDESLFQVEHVREVVSFKKDCTEKQVEAIAHAFEKGFSNAMEAEDAPVEEEKKGNGKKAKSGEVATN